MHKLDRNRDFGRVTPPWQPDNCDRAAHYEQGGKLFDQHGHEIVPGRRGPAATVSEAPALETGVETLSITDLMANADTIPFPTLRKRAREILGETCPSGKQAIIAALTVARQGYEERQARRVAAATQEQSTDDDDAPEVPPSMPAVTTVNGIDLAAWGRGKIDRLFAEVQKAIRIQYSKQVTERRDAVEFLIEQGAITAAEARTDV